MGSIWSKLYNRPFHLCQTNESTEFSNTHTHFIYIFTFNSLRCRKTNKCKGKGSELAHKQEMFPATDSHLMCAYFATFFYVTEQNANDDSFSLVCCHFLWLHLKSHDMQLLRKIDK